MFLFSFSFLELERRPSAVHQLERAAGSPLVRLLQRNPGQAHCQRRRGKVFQGHFLLRHLKCLTCLRHLKRLNHLQYP